MNVVAIDTHAVVKELQAAGFTESQAKVVTRVVRRAQEIDFSDFVTKADLSAAIGEVRSEIAALRTGLRAELRELELRVDAKFSSVEAKIEAVRSDTIKWVIGAIGFQTLVILGAVLAVVKLSTH